MADENAVWPDTGMPMSGALTQGNEAPPPSTEIPQNDEAAAAREARETVSKQTEERAQRRFPGQLETPEPPRPPGDRSGIPQDDGIQNLERLRLNRSNSFYRGTVAGALRMAALASIYRSEDAPDLDPDRKRVNQEQREEYERIMSDLIAYDMMPSWSGLPQLGAAVLGTLEGAVVSPESFLGWAAKGATWTARTMNAAVQQGLISTTLDPAIQLLGLKSGTQDEFDPWGPVTALAFGGALGAGGHAFGEAAGRLADHFIGQRALRKTMAEMSRLDNDMISEEIGLWTQDPRNGIFGQRDLSLDEIRAKEGLPSFADAVAAEKERLFAENARWRRTSQTRQNIVAEEARYAVMIREASSDIENLRNNGFEDADIAGMSKYYARLEGETPRDAFTRAFDRYYASEERAAIEHFSLDDDVRNYVDPTFGPKVEIIEEIPFEHEPISPRPAGGEARPAEGGAEPRVETGGGGRGEATGEAGPSPGRPGEPAKAAEPIAATQAAKDAFEAEQLAAAREAPRGQPAAMDPERVAAAREKMPRDDRDDLDMLIAMGAAEGNAAERDAQRFRELVEKYAPTSGTGPFTEQELNRIVPAVRVEDPNGNVKIYQAKRGETHEEAAAKVPLIEDNSGYKFNDGFFDPETGRYYTRDQMSDRMGPREANQLAQLTDQEIAKVMSPGMPPELVRIVAPGDKFVGTNDRGMPIFERENGSRFAVQKLEDGSYEFLESNKYGREGALFQPSATDSPEFKRWFGNSAVVDDDGNPLLLFHGTRAGEVTTLRRSMHDETVLEGVAFVPDRRIAERYSKDEGRHQGGEPIQPNVIAGYVQSERLPTIREFYDEVERFYGKEVHDLDIPQIDAYAREHGIKAVDTSAIGEPGEIFVLDPTAFKSAAEARALKTERTAQGEQTLIPGVEPITDKQRAEAGMAAPLRGGEKAPPAGGLFDEGARAQGDIFDKAPPDVMPLRTNRQAPMPGEERRPDPGIVAASQFTPEEARALKTLHQMTLKLAELFGFPVRQGRLGMVGTDVSGIYKTRAGVVRVREIADFETVKHEAGHALEAKVGSQLQADIQNNFAELGRLDYDPTRMDPREGFAEWMRIRMANPAGAAFIAPNFSQTFEATMARLRPDLLRAIDDMVVSHRNWLNASDVDATQAVVRNTIRESNFRQAMNAIAEDGIPATTSTVLQKVYQATIDKYAPMERAVRELARLRQQQQGGGLVDLRAAYDPSILIRSAMRSAQATHIQLLFGNVDYHDVNPEGFSFKDALDKALGKHVPLFSPWDEHTIERFDAYLAARMSDYLWTRYNQGLIPNEPSPIKPSTSANAVRELEQAFPTFREAADMIQDYVKRLRKKSFDAGLMSADVFKEAEGYDFYVPMRRVMEGSRTGGLGGTRDQSSLASGVRKRVGSERDIDSPLRNIMRQANAVERDIRRNDVLKALVQLSESVRGEGGRYAERLPATEARKYTTNLEEMIEDAGKKAGLNPADVRTMIDTLKGSQQGDLIGEFWKMERAAARGEPIAFLWENGKPTPIRLMTKEEGHGLFELMTEAPAPILDLWTNIIQIGATGLRAGITNSPAFLLSNYIRDQMQVALTRPGYVPFVSGLPGIWSEVTQGEAARMRAYAGGVMGGSLVGEIQHKFEADILTMRHNGYLTKHLSSWKGAFEMMQMTEHGTRNSVLSSVYKSKLKQGLSPYEAMMEAAHVSTDIMDFSRHGDRMDWVRRLVPFLNANIQGQDRYLWRIGIEPFLKNRPSQQVTLRDREKFNQALYTWMAAGAGGIAFGAAFAALNWDRGGYQDASPDIKGTHFYIPLTDGKALTVPKPFEMGNGFTFGEYAYAMMAKNDPRAASQFAEAVMAAMNVPNPVKNMPIVTPYLELMTNTSFYRNRPIVPDSVQNKAHPELEYTERTSPLAKEAGRMLGLSPMKIEYGIGALFGTWGKDVLLASAWADKDSPSAALDDMIGARRFIKEEERVSGRTRQFWDLMAAKNGRYAQDADAYRRLVKEATIRGEPITKATNILKELPDAEKAFVIMSEGANSRGQPAFHADDKRLHPLVRAHDAVTVLNGIAKDLQNNALMAYRAQEKVLLSPQQRRDLIDQVHQMAGMEMRNAFVAVGEPGYVGRPIFDTRDVMTVVRHFSPVVADEIATRMAANKVYSFDAVREVWPQVQKEVTEMGSEARLAAFTSRVRSQGYEFGAQRMKRPGPVRQPIAGTTSPTP